MESVARVAGLVIGRDETDAVEAVVVFVRKVVAEVGAAVCADHLGAAGIGRADRGRAVDDRGRGVERRPTRAGVVPARQSEPKRLMEGSGVNRPRSLLGLPQRVLVPRRVRARR